MQKDLSRLLPPPSAQAESLTAPEKSSDMLNGKLDKQKRYIFNFFKIYLWGFTLAYNLQC